MSAEEAGTGAPAGRSFSVPGRPAPLAARAAELRLPGAWIEVCRQATRWRPEWLEDRLQPSDPLVEAVGLCGNGHADEAAARAVCALALGLCGRLDEAAALAPAAEIAGEVSPSSLSALDEKLQPRLGDLVAALRAERPARVRRVATVVASAEGRASLGVATVASHPERAGGLRLDMWMRLFAPADDLLDETIAAARAQLGGADRSALLVRVEEDNGEPAGGEACGAAIVAAADAASRGRPLDERLRIAGALGGAGELRRSDNPPWSRVAEILRADGRGTTSLAPADGTRTVETTRALRRALGGPVRRRRAIVAAVAAVLCMAAAAALVLPNLGTDPDADRAARQALELLPASPMRAAVSAARALSLSDDRLSRGAAARVLAGAPLTEAAGQERGHLVAVALDRGGRRVITVSTEGRATRWKLHEGRVLPLDAVAFPAGSDLLAISPTGRWLLVRPPESFERALLVDTRGLRATRYLEAPEETAYAVGGEGQPVVATVGDEGLELTGASSPQVGGDVEEAAFSPSGRLLAVARNGGATAIFRRSGRGWRIFRDWRRELFIGYVSHLEVDDRGRTLVTAAGLGGAALWASRERVGEYETTEGVGSLAGRSLFLVPDEHELRLMQAAHGGSAEVASLPAPVDGATERQVAVSPGGERAVVAGPDGVFQLIDLRLVRTAGNVVVDSMAVRGGHLSALAQSDGGTRLVSWDLDRLAPATVGPTVPGDGWMAVPMAGGSLVASCSGRSVVVIRRTSDGEVVGRLRGRGGESWGNLATDRGGQLLAAIDAKRGAVTAWRLDRRTGGRIAGRIVFRGKGKKRPLPRFPEPLAISPQGTTLVYGTSRILVARDLRSGSQVQIPMDGIGEVVRVRFPIEGRLLVASAGGAFAISGERWSESRRLATGPVHDARFLRSGLVAMATVDGIQLWTGRDSIPLSNSVDAKGTGTGTLSAAGGDSAVVPNGGDLPLVVFRDLAVEPERLCALAGGRGVGGDDRCTPPPPLPAPLPSRGTAADRSADVALSAEGLGWMRLGQPLPAAVKRLPGYSWGACALRTLPGRGVFVVSRDDEIESISLFPAAYAEEGAGYREELETATDRGLEAGNGPIVARSLYGRPDETAQETMRWWLPRRDGGRSLLTAPRSYSGSLPVSVALEEARCEGWG